jgi:DNA polymerase
MAARTFDSEKICWFDFETKSGEDLTKAGATRYACDRDAAAIILTYAIGHGPVRLITAPRAANWALSWHHLPLDFTEFYYRVELSPAHGVFAAFNAGFDRNVWNFALRDAPQLFPDMCIDPSVQATAAGLPPDLAGACKASGSTAKVEDGNVYIKLFCMPDSTATPQSHPAEWAKFCAYAIGDIEAMRSLFLRTRQLPLREWQEYWAAEFINDRGIGVDVKFARKANKLAGIAKTYGGLELRELTDGMVTAVGQVKPLIKWLRYHLPPDGDGMKILTKREEEEADDGTIVRPAKYSLTRSRIEKLIPYCAATGHHQELRALQIRLYGGSTTPAKYSKILAQEVDDTVYGQYVFNGAPQTGRFSSRGVQIQNLARSFLPYEHDAIEAILNGADYDELAQFGDDTPVLRKLALLIRPTFVPKGTNQFVVSDFAQIEARILPWLVGADSAGAQKRLQIFRDVDENPKLPDLYTRTAADISGIKQLGEVTKALRQRGKVAELALGFGGGVGALANMGANYGLYLPHHEAKELVQLWREANPWCVRFWGRHDADSSYGLWGAANRALEQPGTAQIAGRVAYVYLPQILKGTLYCQLPSGRCLAYRGIKYEKVDDLDEDDNVIGQSVQLRFWKGHSRAKIWHGIFCENVVQATAADILRGTLVRLEQAGMGVRLHSHDEVLIECAEADVPGVANSLRYIMRKGFDWTDGLPLMSEETIQSYYSKWEGK